MAAVRLYVHANVPNDSFLYNAHREKLIELHLDSPPDTCIRFECGGCACSSRDHIVVQDTCVVVSKEYHDVRGYPAYAVPESCTDSETVTLVAWLLRYQFYTFVTKIVNGSLVRGLAAGRMFKRQPHACPRCECHRLVGDPVFCLAQCVLFREKKGPSVESVVVP